ncbi:hypothetical protein [Puia dinghuensis]|uniref:hypothetical protein n=1 Tax=Puia dinghuensis TaxID=1792502 RepID=UPI001663B8B3|nr:hypothetical protein [Puia dinghuensis]
MNKWPIIGTMLFSLFCCRATAQMQEITGTVFDKTRLFTMPGVSVLSNSGAGTMTDSAGHYRVRLPLDDSIYFSYLGRHTAKIAVRRIARDYPLNMSLAVTVDSLPLVVVKPTPYRYDSLANREEYRKVFDYSPDYIVGGSGAGVGLSLDAIFNARKIRQTLALQRRLIEEEQDKYVDYRFNRTLVKKITGLQKPLLDTFMRLYRPSYDFIRNCENDYEFYKYIKDCGFHFREAWRRNLPVDHPHPLEN